MAFGSFEDSGSSQPMAEINTTPLVDVMLVLLIAMNSFAIWLRNRYEQRW